MGAIVEAPIRGAEGLYLTIKPAGAVDPAEEYDGNTTAVEFTEADREGLTFAEVVAGAIKAHGIKFTGIASLKQGSLFRLFHDNPGGRFDVVVGFGGNAVADADSPHYVGTVKANGIPLPKKTANTDVDSRETFEYECRYVEGPTLDEGI